MGYKNIEKILGEEAHSLLEHTSHTISKNELRAPSIKSLEETFIGSDRNIQVLRSLKAIFNHGRLKGTGYLSILPVDQGVEHTAGASFAANPIYFDPERIIELAIEGGCSAVATTLGALALIARKYAHKIPFIAKVNHNESLTYPAVYKQTMYGSVKEAWNLGAAAVGATIYFGSETSNKELEEIAFAFEEAHALGMATILWCYPRNRAFVKDGIDFHTAADLTGQANYLGVTLRADFIKQKLPTTAASAFSSLKFGKTHPEMQSLIGKHPIDWCRYQVANGYMGKIGLINSGGASTGENDFRDVIRTAVINKRAGGVGLISGRKAFQRPIKEGIQLLQAIQDVYLEKKITLA